MAFFEFFLDNLGDARHFYELFVTIATTNKFFSFLAVVFSVFVVAVILYSFIERALDFVAQFKTGENSKKKRAVLIAVLSISTFFSITSVNNIVNAHTPRPYFLTDYASQETQGYFILDGKVNVVI
ncbi:MAG: hypothetical protein AAFO95_21110 [Cyanobacteria bacterium J06600_6]